MNFEIRYSNQFRRQYKKLRSAQKKNIIIELEKVVDLLSLGKKLSIKYRNHKLTGNLKDFFECHIVPDWLLIYRIYEDILVLELVAMGKHGNLFR